MNSSVSYVRLLTVSIEGMTCGSCSRSIEKALSGMESINKVQVSLLSNTAVIEYAASETFNDESIIDEIEDLGFTAKMQSCSIKKSAHKTTESSDNTKLPDSINATATENTVIWQAHLCIDPNQNKSSKTQIPTESEWMQLMQSLPQDAIVWTDYKLVTTQDELNQVHAQLTVHFNKLLILPVAITDHINCNTSKHVMLSNITLNKINIAETPRVSRVHESTTSNNPCTELVNTPVRVFNFILSSPNPDPNTLNVINDNNDAQQSLKPSNFDLDQLEPKLMEKFGNSIKNIQISSNCTTPDTTNSLQLRLEWVSTESIKKVYFYLTETLKLCCDPTDSLQFDSNEFHKVQMREVCKLRSKLFISCIFAIPALLVAMVLPYLSDEMDHFLMKRVVFSARPHVSWMAVILFFLCTPVQFYVGSDFYKSCYHALRRRTSNMSTLIAFGTSTAWLYSFLGLLLGLLLPNYSNMKHASHFFETGSTVITVVVLGKLLQAKAKLKTSEAITLLMDLQPSQATVITTSQLGELEKEELLSTELVDVGDVLKVFRGSKIPLDGRVIAGSSAVDESMLTGESMPKTMSVGDEVVGGCINCGDAVFFLRVGKLKSETMLAQMIDLMKDSQLSKPSQEEFADVLSSYFVPVVLFISITTFLTWYLLCLTSVVPQDWFHGDGPVFFSLQFAMAVVVIACPCALGLATPTAVMVGVGVGSKFGLLIKGGSVLELGHNVDTLIFDKTGTLTRGQPTVVKFEVFSDNNLKKSSKTSDLVAVGDKVLTREQILRYAGSAETHSEHPLGQAIVKHVLEALSNTSNRRESELLLSKQLDSFEVHAGKGVEATVGGVNVKIGNYRWLFEFLEDVTQFPDNLQLSDIKNEFERNASLGRITLCMTVENKVVAIVVLYDPPKPEAKFLIEYLKKNTCIKTVMLTGDSNETARAVGHYLGLDDENIISQVLPQDKHCIVKRAQQGLPLTCSSESSLTPNELESAREDKQVLISRLKSDTTTVADLEELAVDLDPLCSEPSPSSGHVSEMTVDAAYKHCVGMVGDGVNDSAALTQADLGVAVGNGTDIALEAANVILLNDNLQHIITLLDLSRTSIRRIYWNFFWALGFNCTGIPIAAGVLYPFWGTRLPPEFAALAMACSSLAVLASSLQLKRYTSPVSKMNMLQDDNEVLSDALVSKTEAEVIGKITQIGARACTCDVHADCTCTCTLQNMLLTACADAMDGNRKEVELKRIVNIFEKFGVQVV